MADALPFVKGHGTENDFVLIPDEHGTLALTPQQVSRLADRRAGIGGDGVIRVVRTEHAQDPAIRQLADHAPWFMDYRNADGSVAQMCGNGTRVFAAYLIERGWASGPTFTIATRTGVKTVRVTSTGYAVDLGPVRVDASDGGTDKGFNAVVTPSQGPDLPGLRVDVGNPHTVVLLPTEVELSGLNLTQPPHVAPAPVEGTNVEFVKLLGPGHLAMRVHERGVGETRSCGTGAVAAAAATSFWQAGPGRSGEWTVDVPGGRLQVTLTGEQTAILAGPAALVAHGTFDSSS